MLGKIEGGGEGDDRGWDGWMASPTQWTWVWVSSRSWWRTGKPGMLRFMGSQSWTLLSDWTELKWRYESRFSVVSPGRHLVLHHLLTELYCCFSPWSECICVSVFLNCILFLLYAQSLICVRLFAIPWTAARQASLSFIIPGVFSNSCPLSLWCHPTIVSSVIPFSSAFNLSQHQGLFQWVSSSHQVIEVLEFQLQHQSFQWIFRTDFL